MGERNLGEKERGETGTLVLISRAGEVSREYLKPRGKCKRRQMTGVSFVLAGETLQFWGKGYQYP
jgi:hypothetical protein